MKKVLDKTCCAEYINKVIDTLNSFMPCFCFNEFSGVHNRIVNFLLVRYWIVNVFLYFNIIDSLYSDSTIKYIRTLKGSTSDQCIIHRMNGASIYSKEFLWYSNGKEMSSTHVDVLFYIINLSITLYIVKQAHHY